MATNPGNQASGGNPATRGSELLSAREYAAHRGVSHQAVGKALRAGRLKESARKVGRQWRIDPELADEEWGRSTDASLQRGAAAKPAAKRKPAVEPPTDAQLAGDEPPPAAVLEDPKPLPRDGDFQDWRERREEMQARMLHLDVLERHGSLLETVAVRAALYDAGRQLRNGLLALAPELAGTLAGCTDPREVSALLEKRIHQVLEGFDRGLGKLGGAR